MVLRSFRVVMLGSGGVGKSCLTVRFVHSLFVEKYDPTIEDSYQKVMTVDGYTCNVEILDTAGTEQFLALQSMYMKQGDGFILAFSLTSLETLSEVHPIHSQILRHKELDNGTRKKVPMVLVGNKCDLVAERQVARDDAIALSQAWNCPFYECSARKGVNITQVFEDVLRQMVKAGAGDTGRHDARGGRKRRKCVVV